MAQNLGMSTPTIVINSNVIAIVPNSLTYDKGWGEYNIRAESAGGTQVQTVITRNAETMISKVSFELVNRIANIDLTDSWKRESVQGGNVIELSEGSNFVVFNYMALTNMVEITAGVDGVISVEFQGPPIVR